MRNLFQETTGENIGYRRAKTPQISAQNVKVIDLTNQYISLSNTNLYQLIHGSKYVIYF